MNIVFDLGGVLYTWKPQKIILRYFPEECDQKRIWEQVLTHDDWADLDRGILTYQEAALRGGERTGLPQERIRDFLEGVPSALQPVDEVVDILKSVKKKGHRTYLLSNMHTPAMNSLEKNDFMNLFDGKLYSCQINQVKPHRDIYETLLTKFRLNPSETIFIDDTPENLLEPAALGMGTIRFLNPGQCQKDLERLS